MVAEQINQVVDMVAEKLGVAVDAVYPMLIKQAKVFCSTYHITLCVFGISILMIVLFSILYYKANHPRWDESLENVACGGLIIFVILSIGSFMITVFDCTQYLTALHNPEWWAIEYVTKLVK